MIIQMFGATLDTYYFDKHCDSNYDLHIHQLASQYIVAIAVCRLSDDGDSATTSTMTLDTTFQDASYKHSIYDATSTTPLTRYHFQHTTSSTRHSMHNDWHNLQHTLFNVTFTTQPSAASTTNIRHIPASTTGLKEHTFTPLLHHWLDTLLRVVEFASV